MLTTRRLAAAQAAANAHTIIYVHTGDGTAANQNQGLSLNKTGQQLIGAGTAFVYDGNRFTTANGAAPSSTLIAPAATAPVISNVNANGDGITVTANNVSIAGVTIDGASRDGILIEADGAAASAQNVTIRNVTARNNRTGIYIHGTNNGSVSALVQGSVTTANSQHGVAVYDDTGATFEADLGGGALGSSGGNTLTGNTLEDIAVEYDGRTLPAQNNWWGQAGGPLATQIYKGAPLNTNLVMNWTFDDGTARDRSGNGYNGTLTNTPTAASGALHFDAADTDSVTGVDVNESDTGNALSVFFRMNPDTLTVTQTLIGKWSFANTVNDNTWAIRATNADATNLIVFIADNPDGGNNFIEATNANLTAGTAAHVGFVFDGTGITNADRLKVYKDGAALNGNFTGAIPAGLNSTNETIRLADPLINNPGFAQPFDGSVDDVRIYNRALSPAEIAELNRMNTSSASDTSGFLTAAP